MKNRLKKLFALLLALAMAFAMFGCAGETSIDDVDDYDEYIDSIGDDTESGDDDAVADNTADSSSDAAQPSQVEELTTSFETNDETISALDVVQVMARGLNADDGQLFDMTDFVAGKNTVLAVEFASEQYIAQDGSMTLTIERDGEFVSELLPINSGDCVTAFFSPRTAADVDNWASGEYTFTYASGDSTAVRTASFRDAKKIKVLAVPVIANYGGQIAECEGEWKTAIQFTKDCYPLAEDGVEYILGNAVDLSDSQYDLTTDEGMYYVWEALASLQTPSNDYELILGFVRYRQGTEGTLQGYTYGSPANIITESDGDMQPTVAHEIAHCYNVGDEYPGGTINNAVNPAPYGMEGSDWVNRDSTAVGNKEAVISANDYGNNNTGSIVFSDQIPMNSRELTLLENVGSFMGSGSDQIGDYWITSDIWEQLFKAFVYNDSSYTASESSSTSSDTASSETYICPGCYETVDMNSCALYAMCDQCEWFVAQDINSLSETFECDNCASECALFTSNLYFECPDCGTLVSLESIQQSSQQSAMGKVSIDSVAEAETTLITAIDIMGRLSDTNEFTASPWYSYEAERGDIDAKTSGDYSVVMKDADGNTLSTQYFNVNFYTNSNPPSKLTAAPVNITVKLHENAASIVLMHGDTEVYSVALSESYPEIAFTGINDYDAFTGKTDITWDASDADGDKLYYELWYCPSEGEFINIATNIETTSYTVNFDELAGTDEGYFYLYATDGVNTVGIDSPWITVEYKAPEIITAQSTIPQYKMTDEILFDVDVYDMQDGWLYESDEISWTLNGREYLTGSLLWVYPYELIPGENTFTLTATNSHGVQATKDFTFNIVDDESALPNDWSTDDIRSALSNGFVAPLANVASPITRGQFARLMSNLYFTVYEDGSPLPDYEEGIVTDCGQDDYDQYLMVALGVMEAENGRFYPNGQLTQEEAAIIMYRLCAIADPNVCEDSTDIAEIVEILINSLVMDESGENAYDASAKITGQLALVRCNRLFEAIFGE